eukprot:scaffold2368_cov289-Chaetoceros_neogracile.AAC.16
MVERQTRLYFRHQYIFASYFLLLHLRYPVHDHFHHIPLHHPHYPRLLVFHHRDQYPIIYDYRQRRNHQRKMQMRRQLHWLVCMVSPMQSLKHSMQQMKWLD